MKKYISLILILLLCGVVLSGCKKADSDPTEAALAVQATAEATEATTEAPTEAATEAPTQAPRSVDPSWFDDAVFIGDSITVSLDYLSAADPDMLGYAQFVCGDSLSYHNALWDLDNEYAVHPTYQGQTVLAETAAEVTGASKVFILLGVNDIGTYGAEDTLESAKELAARILSHTPNVRLYFQSTTPMVAAQESGWLNNGKISDFNALLKDYCAENGYVFIDVYNQLCDEEGALKEEYCEDAEGQGIHFNSDGCAVWANYLKIAAAE